MTKMLTGTTLAALGCGVAGAASACSDPGSGGAAPAASGSLNPTASLKGVTLTFWTAQNSVGEPKQVISAFEKATGASVNTVVVPDPYESNFPTKLASGEKPDLAFWQPTQSTLPFINPARNLLPLDNEPWIKRKDPGVASFFEVGGDKWPLQWQVRVQMTDLPDSFWSSLNANKASWTDAKIVSAINKYKTQLLDAGLAQPDYKTGTFVDQGTAVVKGSAAMALNVTSLQSQIQAANSTARMDQALGWFPIANSAARAEYSPRPDRRRGRLQHRRQHQGERRAAVHRLLAHHRLLPMVAVFVIAQRRIVAGITCGAVK